MCTFWCRVPQWEQGRQQIWSAYFSLWKQRYARWNGSVITLAKIIKFVMSSASKAELSAMFITAQEMVAIRQKSQEMKWLQPKYSIQTDKSTAAGVVNNAIVPRKLKTTDCHLHWLRCRESQGQFRYFWASGNLNWGDYSTKHHPPLYHKLKRMQFSGNSNSFK